MIIPSGFLLYQTLASNQAPLKMLNIDTHAHDTNEKAHKRLLVYWKSKKTNFEKIELFINRISRITVFAVPYCEEALYARTKYWLYYLCIYGNNHTLKSKIIY